jgi:23S rRNA pseudouridine1911/1915/1917 synthase
MTDLFDILYEDPNLLVINKPAGLVCHPTKGDDYSSLIGRVRLYLKPEVRPHIINRLDRETSGVTLVAKDSQTARELRAPWERREVTKKYLAIVHGHLSADSGAIDAPLGKDLRSRVAIRDCVIEGGAPAQTVFRVEKRFTRAEGDFSLLEVQPRTGRKHQIRIHLSHIGHPIVGDKLYGLNEQFYLDFVTGCLTEEQRLQLVLPHHGLHASEVGLMWRGRARQWLTPPEPWFSAFAKIEIAK